MRPDDDALRHRIAEEFGIAGGFNWSGLAVEYKGGVNPRITIQIGTEPPLELTGGELLSAVREALHLARPGELF
ncbi:MAG: hypothetical protein IAE94_01350 [Chthoniobacterales bacterium]|nr:hypothetical protein [Chthoniobacterales bacterium]